MARKFVEPDKDKLKERIIEQGRSLFLTYGLKKTSIADITKAVGIAQGSFYLFYPSKEELFADILLREERKIRQTFTDRYWAGGRISRSGLEEMLRSSVRVLEENPLLQQLYDAELMQTLFRKLSPAKLEEMFRQDADDLLPFVQEAQAAGVMRVYPAETVISLFRSVVLLALHKEHIGAAHFDATIRLLAELLAGGLIREGEDSV